MSEHEIGRRAALGALTFKWIDRMEAVEEEAWDRLALPLETPLLEWKWLRELERSGSIAPAEGWYPRHLTVWRKGRLAGVAPLYVKTHSLGEFVYDNIWSEAAGRLNIPYYPKLVGMIPVTPVKGYRFLISPEEDEALLTRRMLKVIDRFCIRHRISGTHFLFVDPDWKINSGAEGYHRWLHPGYLWINRGFRTFDDYLGTFRTNQRRNIRRERRRLAEMGIEIRTFAGGEISPALMRRMYRFYINTNERYGPWGCRYLNREFFDGIRSHFADRLLIVAASRKYQMAEPLGMSLFVRKGELLYGRYWGTAEAVRELHFNVCYYHPIEWGIRNGIRFFDPGVGGDHKMRRGFEAVPTYSYHRFYDSSLDFTMRTHIDEINQMEAEYITEINHAIPFREEYAARSKGDRIRYFETRSPPFIRFNEIHYAVQ